jgi:hypothetical protein
VAAAIKQETGVEPELVEGGRGEFTVWVGDQKVAGKTPEEGFPTEQQVLAAVRQALRS